MPDFGFLLMAALFIFGLIGLDWIVQRIGRQLVCYHLSRSILCVMDTIEAFVRLMK